MDACSVRQGGHRDGAVAFVRTRDEISQMIGDDEAHLPVREDCSLGTSGRSRGVENPERVVVGNHFMAFVTAEMALYESFIAVLSVASCANGHNVAQRRGCRANGVRVR